MTKQEISFQSQVPEIASLKHSSEAATDELDLRDVAVLLYRKMWLILGFIGMFLATAVIYLVLTKPLYTATALLLVDPAQKNLLNPDEGYSQGSMSEAARVESEVEILRSGTVSLATVEKLDLVADPEFGPSLGLREKIGLALGKSLQTTNSGEALLSQTLDRFSAATSIKRRGQTHLIAVSVSSESPARAAQLANTLAETYIALQVEAKVDMSITARDLLENQIVLARQNLAESEDALDLYINQNLARLGHEVGSAEFNHKKAELEAARTKQTLAANRLSGANAAYKRRDWVEVARSLEDSALGSIVSQREDVARRLGVLQIDDTTSLNLREELAKLDVRLDQEATARLNALNQQNDQLSAEIRDKQSHLRNVVLSGSLSSATLAELYDLQQKADIAQQHYKTLLSRTRDLQSQALVQMADSRIVSAALAPRQPSFPNKKLVISFTFVLALGLGVIFAFLSEFYFGGIKSTEQLANVLSIPVGGSVPKIEPRSGHLSVADTVIQSPLSPFAESIRQLRASVDFSAQSPNKACTVIMVTSALPSEGKSSLALALARTYAVAGQSTLLVDTDLRMPSLHHYLGLTPQNGFFEYLRSPEKISAQTGFYDSDPLSKVGVVLGRGRADVPTDQLLQSAIFERFLIKAREAMDVIILDTSPLVPVVDAIYIAQHADVVVNCVRYGKTNQSNLRLAMSRLSKGIRPITPVVSVLTYNEARGAEYEHAYAFPEDV